MVPSGVSGEPLIRVRGKSWPCRLLLCQTDRDVVMRSPCAGSAIEPPCYYVLRIFPDKDVSLSLSGLRGGGGGGGGGGDHWQARPPSKLVQIKERKNSGTSTASLSESACLLHEPRTNIVVKEDRRCVFIACLLLQYLIQSC